MMRTRHRGESLQTLNVRGLASLAAAIATFVAVLGRPAEAHFGERTDSLWGFVARADVIIIGRVVDTRAHEERGHTTRPGAVRLRADETLRGATDAEVGILVEGMHQPRYAPGEQVLVFAERSRGVLRSLQSRSEKVAIAGTVNPAVDAVRRYVAIAKLESSHRRAEELKEFTLELLSSPSARLHQDAVFDLTRPRLLDAAIRQRDLDRLATLALAEHSPLVVREGIAVKLGALAKDRRDGASPILERLAIEPQNAAVRVAALHALRNAAAGSSAMIRSLEAENHWVRLAAVEGLAARRAREAIAAIARRLDDLEPRVRFAAMKALFTIGGPDCDAALERARAQASAETRAMIARAAELTTQPRTKEPR
jgi:hypothetical protein